MTTYRDEFQRSLGADLRDLVPLIEATVQALDKPGTRALRRKLDAQVNTLVHIYGSMCLASEDEGYRDVQSLPRYKRVTAVWPAQKAYDARKAREAEAAAPRLAVVPINEASQPSAVGDRPRPVGRPQLVVHDGGLLGRRKPPCTSNQGDAA